jgi:hypothetical protein
LRPHSADIDLWQVGRFEKPQDLSCRISLASREPDDEHDEPAGLIAASNTVFITALSTHFRAALLAQEGERIRFEAQEAAFESIAQVAEITTEIFGPSVTIKGSYDPEYPGERFVVLCAESASNSVEASRMEAEWIRRVSQLVPLWHGVRLSLKRTK